jgi:hypothetical protein
MFLRRIAVWSWVALVAFSGGTTASAKPADLPSHQPIECAGDDPPMRQLSIDIDISPRGITFRLDTRAVEPEPIPAIDALLPAFVEQWLQHTADTLVRPERMSPERLLRHLPMVLTPMNSLSRAAMELLHGRAEDLGDASEEQTIPVPEAGNRDIRNGSILLGLVEIVH